MQGQVLISASALIAMRDAIIDQNYDEAYHILRMQADPFNGVFLRTGDHWTEWEQVAQAEHAPQFHI